MSKIEKRTVNNDTDEFDSDDTQARNKKKQPEVPKGPEIPK